MTTASNTPPQFPPAPARFHIMLEFDVEVEDSIATRAGLLQAASNGNQMLIARHEDHGQAIIQALMSELTQPERTGWRMLSGAGMIRRPDPDGSYSEWCYPALPEDDAVAAQNRSA